MQIYKKKKIIYIIVKELRKTIKKSMVTGITQKSCTALFLLWSLRKNDILKNTKLYVKGKMESIERTSKKLNVEKKNKSKKYTYPGYALTLKFSL